MKLEGYTEDETTLLVWADAYERCGFSLVTDALFDGLAYEAARKRHTSRFAEHTGQWVNDHRTPELEALTDLCIGLANEQGHDFALVWPKDLETNNGEPHQQQTVENHMTKLHGLIDGDIVLYECIAGKDDEVLAELCYSIGKRIETLVEDCGVDTYEIFLSGPKEVNYRYDVYPAYKAKRPPKPAHIEGAKQYMYDKLDAIEGAFGENDDQLGIAAYDKYKASMQAWEEAGAPEGKERLYSSTVLMTTDKDLKMIPGWHYSWSPKSDHDWIWITLDQGFAWFFTQMLTGDSTDGIPGLKGVGPKAAEKVMAVSKTNAERLANVVDKYVAKGMDLEYLLTMADLLWIQRKREETGRNFIRDLDGVTTLDLEGAFPQPDQEPEAIVWPSGTLGSKPAEELAKRVIKAERQEPEPAVVREIASTAVSKAFAKKGTGKAAEAFAKKRETKVTGTTNGATVVVTEEENETKVEVVSPAVEVVVKKAEEWAKVWASVADKSSEPDHAETLAQDVPVDKQPDVRTYPDNTPYEFDDDIPF